MMLCQILAMKFELMATIVVTKANEDKESTYEDGIHPAVVITF